MDDATRDQFFDELKQVVEKYGLKNAAFCATTEDELFVAGPIDAADGDKYSSATAMFETSANVGRMWQHFRTQVRLYLDSFEKTWDPKGFKR